MLAVIGKALLDLIFLKIKTLCQPKYAFCVLP